MVDRPVTVTFRNGDELDVRAVARLVGADWVTAEILHERDDPEDDELDVETVIIHTDDIRYIRSDYVAAGEEDRNFRIHYGDAGKGDIETVAWQGQYQLHPDDDPSAYHGSGERWPPAGGDPRYTTESE
jgi:hypothetical protein